MAHTIQNERYECWKIDHFSVCVTISWSFWHALQVSWAHVSHSGWVYLWTAQKETPTHINVSSGVRERRAKAKLNLTNACRNLSTSREGKARRGTLLQELVHTMAILKKFERCIKCECKQNAMFCKDHKPVFYSQKNMNWENVPFFYKNISTFWIWWQQHVPKKLVRGNKRLKYILKLVIFPELKYLLNLLTIIKTKERNYKLKINLICIQIIKWYLWNVGLILFKVLLSGCNSLFCKIGCFGSSNQTKFFQKSVSIIQIALPTLHGLIVNLWVFKMRKVIIKKCQLGNWS